MSGPGCRSASSTCRGFARDAFIQQQQKCHDMSENIIQNYCLNLDMKPYEGEMYVTLLKLSLPD